MHLLKIAAAVSVIGTFVVTLFIWGWYPVHAEKIKAYVHQKRMKSMKGPVYYEEVKLEDKTATIDLSQNIAYEEE